MGPAENQGIELDQQGPLINYLYNAHTAIEAEYDAYVQQKIKE